MVNMNKKDSPAYYTGLSYFITVIRLPPYPIYVSI
jgi:hypothetical protein